MKNFLKKAVCSLLILCTFSSSCIMLAVEPENPGSTGDNGAVPLSSMIAMDTIISPYNLSWLQQSGYTAYRIWVVNTTNYTMTVRITGPNGSVRSFTVPAASNRTYTNNDADSGVHTLSFSNGTNYVSGTVRVRVSTEALY